MATVDELGGVKAPGLLVKSEDWNHIVTEIVRLGDTKADKTDLEALRQTILNELSPALSALQTSVTTLTATAAALDARVTALEALRNQFYRVALSSPQSTYLVGASVELVVRLSNLDGSPRTFPSPSTRPFVDFVTTWGILSAASGSSGTVDAEGRSISVRVDQDGVARARLRAEWAFRVTLAQENAMQSVFNRGTTGGKTVEQTLLTANTPEEARAGGAFTVLKSEYRSTNQAFKGYVDKLFAPHYQGDLVAVGNFIDTRATVLAFAKADNNPTSPDPASGAASMQVVFRDWVGPVAEPADVDLPEHLPPHFEPVRTLFEEIDPSKFVRENIPDKLRRFVQGTLEADGLLGRYQQGVLTMRLLDRLSPPTPAGQLVADQAKSLIALAVKSETQGQGFGNGVDGLLGLASQADQRSKDLANDVSNATQATRGFESKVNEFQRQVSTLNGQFQATVAEGGAITNTLKQVAELRTRVDGFDGDRIKPTEVRVVDINNNMFSLSERIRLLENK